MDVGQGLSSELVKMIEDGELELWEGGDKVQRVRATALGRARLRVAELVDAEREVFVLSERLRTLAKRFEGDTADDLHLTANQVAQAARMVRDIRFRQPAPDQKKTAASK